MRWTRWTGCLRGRRHADDCGGAARRRDRDSHCRQRCGNDAEECERPFTRRTTTTKQHGTGLGLAVVQSIIADHQGTISVRSAACDDITASGAEFCDRAAGDGERGDTAGMSAKAEILIVDDEHNTLASLARAFRMAGHEATVCDDAARGSGAGAGQAVRPDPVGCSDAAARRAGVAGRFTRAKGVNAPVVMMSGQAQY